MVLRIWGFRFRVVNSTSFKRSTLEIYPGKNKITESFFHLRIHSTWLLVFFFSGFVCACPCARAVCACVCAYVCMEVIAGDWSQCFCGAINRSSTNWNPVFEGQAWAGLEEAAREGWTRVPIRGNSIISWKKHKSRNSKCFPIRSSQAKHTQPSRDMVLCVLLPHTMCYWNPELVLYAVPRGTIQ